MYLRYVAFDSKNVLICPWTQSTMCCIYTDFIQLYPVVVFVCKLPFQTKVEIMPHTIRPVFLELIVRLWSCACSQREIPRNFRVSRVPFHKSCTALARPTGLLKGYVGTNIKWPHQTKTLPFSISWCETSFSQRPQSEWSWSGELDAIHLSARRKGVE